MHGWLVFWGTIAFCTVVAIIARFDEDAASVMFIMMALGFMFAIGIAALS